MTDDMKAEFAAMATIVKTLAPLDPKQRTKILAAVLCFAEADIGEKVLAEAIARGSDLRVPLSEFDEDPQRYMRQASAARRVIVFHDDTQQISASFGGSLATSPTDEEAR